MYVGILEIRVKIYEAFNLKEKRQVVKSVFEKVKNKFNFSTAEVGDEEMINLSTWGFVCVSNSYSHAQNMTEKLEQFIEEDYRFEVIEIRREIY